LAKAIFSMSDAATARATGNLFLDNMPIGAMNALRHSLVPVTLTKAEIVYDADQAMDRVLFPIGSIISVVLQMSAGDTAEVGIIGREGMTGLAIVLGQSSTNLRSIVQIPNGALSVSTREFRAVVEREAEFKAFSLRYAQAVLTTSVQIAACNSLHPIIERCARWLLMAHDRVGKDLIRLTQEFLSQMLGVRRASVLLAASALQDAGFISYSRGQISVLNRIGLELASCECYNTMAREWKKIMGYNVRESADLALHVDGFPAKRGAKVSP
jgi:CRP-like cAMP-binding protein